MSRKMTLVAIMASLAFVVGGFFAGGSLTTDAALAQTDEAPAATIEESSDEPFGLGRLGGHDGAGFRAGGDAGGALEEILGLTSDELRAAFESGLTLGELAEQQGLTAEELVGALYASAVERIDAAVEAGILDADRADAMKADLEDRIAERVESGVTPMAGGPHSRRGGAHGFFGGDEVLTDVLGMSSEDLRDALLGGATLAEIADDQGVSPSVVIAALVDAATERIDAAVEAGRLDADRAAEVKADLEARITERVENGPSAEGSGPHDGGPRDGAFRRGHGFNGNSGANGEETLGRAA